MKQGMSGVRKRAILLAPFLFSSFLHSMDPIKFAQEQLIQEDGTIDSVFFTQQEKMTIQNVLVGLIRAEQEQISGALFRLSNKVIAKELLEAYQRGVTLEIVFDQGAIGAQVLNLSRAGMPLLIYDNNKRFPALMHHKFLTFHNTLDERSVVSTGSLNITEAGFAANAENVTIRDDKTWMSKFYREFERLKRSSHYLESKEPERTVVYSEGVMAAVEKDLFDSEEPVPSFIRKKSKHKKAWKEYKKRQAAIRQAVLTQKANRVVQFVQRRIK